MKLIHLPVLSLILASTAPAADFSPNKIGPLLQKSLPTAAYRLGLDYKQAADEAENKLIERKLHLAIGLPAQTEVGFAVHDTQEAAQDHSSKPLGGQVWFRWNMVQTSIITAAATLQYQPGLSTRESAFQASQDRTSLALDLNLRPWSFISGAVYAGYSRRQNERYQDLILGQETLAGARLTLGHENFGLYGDASQRHLTTQQIETKESRQRFAREWQAGLYLGTNDLQVKAFAMIPDTHRYFGMQERGFGAAIQFVIGASKAAIDPRDQPEDAIVAIDKADREAAAMHKSSSEPEVKTLETTELDEFQLLEEKVKNAAKNQQETPAEKAERELRQSLEIEKKMEAQKLMEAEKAQRKAVRSAHEQLQRDDAKLIDYKDDADQEINRYALPDQDELNWNGLTP